MIIKFFRKIRQKLLSENKFSKYLLYAIGEIVLVVIGILIALQINNWNESEKLKEKERYVLIEILSDLEMNISILKEIIQSDNDGIDMGVNSIKIILDHIENSATYNESLGLHFWNIFRYPDLEIKTSGYESLTSIGMDLIQDKKIRSQIGQLYTSVIPDNRAAYREVRDDFYNYMLNFLKKEFTTYGIIDNDHKIIPLNYEQLKNNHEFKQALRTYIGILNYYKNKSMVSLKNSRDLKKNIELYLEKE